MSPSVEKADGSQGDAPLAWASTDDMNAFEAVMWRIEADPMQRASAMAIEELDTTPDWDRFVAAHEWATRMAPRFRQRVVEGPLGVGAPRWTTDPEFDVRYHVRRIRLPEGSGWTQLLDAAAQIGMTPLDRSRSPWQVVLFEGLPDGRAGYMLKLHHSTTDGHGFMQLLGQLHSRTREPGTKPQPAYAAAEPITPVDALLHQVRADAQELPRATWALGSRLFRAAASPTRSVRDAVEYGASLKRVLSPPDCVGSPLLAERSLNWRFAVLEMSFADLKAAGKAAGGSLNDAFMAGLLGGFRLYHEAMGVPVVDAIPTAIPVSIRTSDDAQGGNHIASARFAGPVAMADPTDRIQRIRQLVGAARTEPAVDVIGLASPLLARLPGSVIAQLAGPMTKGNDLQASNVPGLGEELYLAGAKIERMYGFGPLPGCASMITLITHGRTACVGINMDAAAFTEPDTFVSCVRDGFAEVLALHPGAATPTVRA
ncbi:wax ester/triacylglycerol synthase domain-containing protein [Pseudonocardia spinosispora]|uniref:wax ester/triacylglycerol synthase domain-containing protein n=1 Tax=Pseudonocardia spinosispora TaxID=103441 RepID=UPI00041E8454|nr:wax ester/triacylglycerol synthase domain-containing protein [Pseudonocardia spinosispora]